MRSRRSLANRISEFFARAASAASSDSSIPLSQGFQRDRAERRAGIEVDETQALGQVAGGGGFAGAGPGPVDGDDGATGFAHLTRVFT